jgi:threonine dehydrogenase-like Zn-dependent dehydrogenase
MGGRNMKMKAAVVEKQNTINVKEVQIPDIDAHEVLIKVKYTGICGTDWSIYTGKYSADRLPLIPGHEFSGTIAKAGKNVRGLEEGDRVTADINMSCGHCFYCRKGLKLMCPEFTQLGIHTHGTYAEYVKVPWEQVHRLPESIDFLKGAFIEPVSCVIHSAKAMDAAISSSVAILGSGLGALHAAVSRLRGAAPIIVVGRNRHKLAIARTMGADFTLSIDEVDDPVEAVRDLTEGRGADYVIEAIGTPQTYEQAFQMVRPGGTVASFGITAPEDTIEVRPFDLVLGEKNVTGSCAGVGNDWTEAINLLKWGRIDPSPLFSMIVPLSELETALKEIQENRSLFKVFVSPQAERREMLG